MGQKYTLFKASLEGLNEGVASLIGKFNAKKRVARNIINPATKKMMRLPALANVLFRPSQNVKDLLNK